MSKAAKKPADGKCYVTNCDGRVIAVVYLYDGKGLRPVCADHDPGIEYG